MTVRRRTLPLSWAAVFAALMLLVAWVAARNYLESDGRSEIAATLESRLSVTETALDRWQVREVSTAEAWATNGRVLEYARGLLDVDRSQSALLAAPEQVQLRDHLAPVLQAFGYQGFFVIAPDGTSLASTRDANTGTPNLLLDEQAQVFDEIWAGSARVTHPLFTDIPIENAQGVLDSDAPTMFVGAPILDEGEVIAVLTFRIAPEQTFTEVFTTQRWGDSGEAFVVGETGTLLVESRFEDELVAAGVLAEGESHFNAITLEDPGVDVREASGVSVPDRSDWVRTEAAVSVLAGNRGSASTGYDSYLGRPVVGTWTWNDDLGMGLVVEVDEAEATAVVHRAILSLDLFAAAALATTLLAGFFATRERRQRRDLERLNESLEESQANLRQVNEDLSHFAYLAAHDLREPCRRQQMLTNMLMELDGPELSENVHNQLQLIATQSASMLSMIDGFRALTNIVGPGLERSVVDLDQMVASLVDQVVPPELVSGVVVDLPSDVAVYPELVDILYRKLLSNATEYGSLPCDIRLSAISNDGVTVYSVSNAVAAGTRVSARDLLQPFVRGTDAKGAGLGLSICKRVVDFHHGTINVDQRDDRIEVQFTLEEHTQ